MSAESEFGGWREPAARELMAAVVAEQAALRAQLAQQRSAGQRIRAEIDQLMRRMQAERTLLVSSSSGTVGRRRLLQLAGAGVAGGAAFAAGRTPTAGASGLLARIRRRNPSPFAAAGPGASAPVLTAAKSATSPTIVVAPPTGKATSDMPAILSALKKAAPGMTVVFQGGGTPYAIDQELPVPRGIRITGRGPASQSASAFTIPTLQQVAGVNLVCIAASANYLYGLYGPTHPGKYPTYNKLYNEGVPTEAVISAIEVDHLAFDGQNGGSGAGNTTGHGMVMFTYGANIHDCFFVDTPQTGIYLADCNYLNQSAVNENHENRIEDNVVINPGWWGIRVDNDVGGAGGATDGHILRNVIRSPSKQRSSSGPNINKTNGRAFEGVFMANAAGWWIVDNHLIACPGDGVYTNTTGGLHLDFNTVDGFGCHPQAHEAYTGFNITTAGQTKLHPGRIIGNLVAAYEGANPYTPSTVAVPTTTYQYFKMAMQSTPGRQPQSSYDAYPTHADNVAHQASAVSAPITGATIPTRAYVAVPTGKAAAVKPGVGITDSAGLIKGGTTVTSVTPGTGTSPDLIYLSSKATARTSKGETDTVSFLGPKSIAWTYSNGLPAANMWVHRTNEMATGTIDATPVIQIKTKKGKVAPTVTLIDPVDYIGTEYVKQTAAPVAGDLIVAGSTAAVWKAVKAKTAVNTASGVLSGTFPAPDFSAQRVTQLTASGSYTVQSWASRVRITCVGGGGGGGGGTGGKTGQVGGGGGAAGATASRVVGSVAGETLVVTIGTGGGGGAGATSGSGSTGGDGGSTVVQRGTTVLVLAGGGAGGPGAVTGRTPVPGGAYGGVQGATTSVGGAGSGGPSGLTGGSPFEFSPGGGGGGGSASGTQGGTGGGAGTATAGGSAGAGGGSGSAAGGAGGSGQTTGAPGGGGGAGAGTSGGAGGSGAGGVVIIEVLG
jgi:hypothetical protein